MTLTSAAAGGGEFTPRKKKEHVILTPGRYKSHQLPESSDIKSMHIDVSVGRPSKQTANISFFGGEDEKHDILNVPLKTYAPQWKAEKDEYYFYEKTPSPERDILVERFIEMGKKFPAALKRLRCGTSWIHINSKDTISFQVKDLSKKRTVATLSLMDDDDSIPKAVKRKTDDDESKVQGAKKRKQSKPVRIMKNYEIEEDEWDNTS
ncbi:hypothetical protein FOL47_011051 [Perkinsus chesapeaki]|uniref:Uncharacterized protein n=1 Tax=Perkinsus chesapeaki TaxID=330153 RepID=A0A7J6L1F2_PERCH|nr:hypothetical protein FOL47_011051 [Perkinsus chesapeaki]